MESALKRGTALSSGKTIKITDNTSVDETAKGTDVPSTPIDPAAMGPKAVPKDNAEL